MKHSLSKSSIFFLGIFLKVVLTLVGLVHGETDLKFHLQQSQSGQQQSLSVDLNLAPVDLNLAERKDECTKKEGPYEFLPIGALKTNRAGSWLPKDDAVIGLFLKKLRERVAASTNTTLVPPVEALNHLVRSDPALYAMAQAMFYEASKVYGEKTTPNYTPSLQNWDEFVSHLNHIVQHIAPEFYTIPGTENPTGLVAFPINALLDWPMGTLPGYAVFSNAKFNEKMKDVLNYWAIFLNSTESTYTLINNLTDSTYLGWLSPPVKKQVVEKVNAAVNNQNNFTTFEEVFKCDPRDHPFYGFKNWDEFFIRDFNHPVRPVDDPLNESKIANACESAPLRLVKNVKLEDKFWLKEQAYSLKDMIGSHEYAASFANGTVYQAFLDALSFHRWRSPVSGRVVASYKIPGTYYLQSYYKGFEEYDKHCPNKSDPAAPNDSQPFLSSVSTRSVIIIESNNTALGKVAFVAIGMAEVASCENMVKEGDSVSKGQLIGMFHYGGSSHCLVFESKAQLEFIEYINKKKGINAPHNVAISSTIATVIQ